MFLEEVSDELFSDLSTQLPKVWKRVAIKLGLKANEIEAIELNNRKVEDQTMKMLCQWKRKRGSSATRTLLMSVLIDVECIEVAEFVYAYIDEQVLEK